MKDDENRREREGDREGEREIEKNKMRITDRRKTDGRS